MRVGDEVPFSQQPVKVGALLVCEIYEKWGRELERGCRRSVLALLTRRSASEPSPALTAEKLPGEGGTGVSPPTAGDAQRPPAVLLLPEPPPLPISRRSLLSGSGSGAAGAGAEPMWFEAAANSSSTLMVEVLLLKSWRGLVGENRPTWPASGMPLQGMLHIPIC